MGICHELNGVLYCTKILQLRSIYFTAEGKSAPYISEIPLNIDLDAQSVHPFEDDKLSSSATVSVSLNSSCHSLLVNTGSLSEIRALGNP